MVGLTSASGLVGFLSEPDPELRVFALKTLDAEVDVLWTDIVDAIPQMYVSLQTLLAHHRSIVGLSSMASADVFCRTERRYMKTRPSLSANSQL